MARAVRMIVESPSTGQRSETPVTDVIDAVGMATRLKRKRPDAYIQIVDARTGQELYRVQSHASELWPPPHWGGNEPPRLQIRPTRDGFLVVGHNRWGSVKMRAHTRQAAERIVAVYRDRSLSREQAMEAVDQIFRSERPRRHGDERRHAPDEWSELGQGYDKDARRMAEDVARLRGIEEQARSVIASGLDAFHQARARGRSAASVSMDVKRRVGEVFSRLQQATESAKLAQGTTPLWRLPDYRSPGHVFTRARELAQRHKSELERLLRLRKAMSQALTGDAEKVEWALREAENAP